MVGDVLPASGLVRGSTRASPGRVMAGHPGALCSAAPGGAGAERDAAGAAVDEHGPLTLPWSLPGLVSKAAGGFRELRSARGGARLLPAEEVM
jgi:hypothetical protein